MLCTETHLAMLQAHDLLDVLDLSVACDLGHAGFTHIEQLAPAAQVSSVPLLPISHLDDSMRKHSSFNAYTQVLL